MEEIDPLLEKYEPGKPQMKPDVLKQIAQIEKDREKMIQDEMAKNGQIMLNQPGKPPVALTAPQVVEMLTKQNEQIHVYEKRIQELESINMQLQKMLAVKSQTTPVPVLGESSKSEPLFRIDSLTSK